MSALEKRQRADEFNYNRWLSANARFEEQRPQPKPRRKQSLLIPLLLSTMAGLYDARLS